LSQLAQRTKKLTMGAAAFAALGLGGAAIAGAATSGSSTPTTTTSSTTAAVTAPSEGSTDSGAGFTAANAPGTAAHESVEKVVTGADAAKAQAAAVASVGGGTAGAVTGDFRNSGAYEVTVTKSDGSQVTVRLDSTFKAETGGGPDGAH
jgi:hypothetical protein